MNSLHELQYQPNYQEDPDFDTVYSAVLKNRHSKEVMALPGSKSTFKTDAQDYADKFIAVNAGWFILFIDEQREYR